MNRKILLAILAVLIGVVKGFSQDNTVIWGIKASVDVELPGKWHYNGGVTMYRPGCGFTIGGVSNIYLGKNFYFEPSVAIAYSQYKYKDVVFGDPSGMMETDPKIYKWSFQMPLVAGYTIEMSDDFALNVFTGPQLRYAFDGKIVFKNKEMYNDANEYVCLWNGQRRFDISWKVGVGIPVNNFLFSLEADFGITDLLKSDISFRENRVGTGVTYYF